MSIALSCCERVYDSVAKNDGAAYFVARASMTSVSLQRESLEPRERVDARLVERMAQRDHQALGELYDRFSGPLYAMALRVLRDSNEAQDVVHDAFVTLWEKAATFDPARGSAFSWAVTLVRNRAIDLVRMRRRRAELLSKSVPADLGYAEESPVASGGETAALDDEARAVRAAVGTLPLDQKRALELAFFSGFTQEEIALKLSEPLGTIKARIRRGLLKLRESLARRL
ncbi:MAG: sigma-70 family RNA polymerase sigma factor [Gammaproteobacteria bacterium]